MVFIADIRTAVKNKVPLVRSLTLNWVTFCIETSNKAVVLKAHKDYVPICMEVSACGLTCVLFFWLVVTCAVLTWDLWIRGFNSTFLMSGNASPLVLPLWSDTRVAPLLGHDMDCYLHFFFPLLLPFWVIYGYRVVHSHW